LVREIAPLLKLGISKKVELELELDQPLPPVEADASQMQQMMMNLVINGAEAIGDHQSGIVRVAAAPRPGGVEVAVSDNGCGMSEELAGRIFDPFFSTKFTGRGLGLAAVQGIVRAHRGTIQVETAPGSGTTFRITLPSAVRLPEATAGEAVGDAAEAAILVVDDEELVQSVTGRMLERMGYRVLLANSGPAAIELHRQNRGSISLVLLDWVMPGMNGEETLRALRQTGPDLPVVICTGNGQGDAAARFGASSGGLLQKPFTIHELAEKVTAVMRAWRARNPN
jgi:CheY-like chemotaxis protein